MTDRLKELSDLNRERVKSARVILADVMDTLLPGVEMYHKIEQVVADIEKILGY